MAAIYGVVAIASGIDIETLASRIEARQAYRAPDGDTRWRGEGCVLGHGALHIGSVPLASSQPLRLRDGRICIVDGYLANYDSLRRNFAIDAAIPLDDAHVFALAIERWGDAFTDHVQGEFAVALWDPAARRLQLFRDHLGARPICYVQTRDMFAFASASIALAGLPGVPARLDPLGIVTMWYDEAAYLKADYSAFEAIAMLPPAHSLTWDEAAGANIRRDWRLQPEAEVRLNDEGEYVEAFQEVFGDAVARSMRGSQQTALMLSGGIDSAAILSARLGFRSDGIARDLLCISAVAGTGVEDPEARAEDANIRAMTATLPNCLRFEVPVSGDPDALVNSADLAEMAWSWIHPADLSLLVPSLACRLAQRRGCRLILNGVDGDNVTSAGTHYIDALVARGHFRRAWHESRAAAKVNTYLRGQIPAHLFVRAAVAVLEPRQFRFMRHRRHIERTIHELDSHPQMAPALALRTKLADRLHEAARMRRAEPAQLRCDHQAWWLGISLGGSESIVSRHGMETRHPWCDLEVVRFFQRLPVDFRVRDGWTKWVVRKSCEPAVGAGVVWHSGKHHLGSLLNRQLLEEARPYLCRLVAEQRPLLAEYIREDAIAQAVSSLAKGSLNEPGECDRVLTTIALAGWIRESAQLSNQG